MMYQFTALKKFWITVFLWKSSLLLCQTALIDSYAKRGQEYLISHLPEIAKELSNHSYTYEKEYTMTPIWEGENFKIPLTLYIFVWPPGSKPTPIHSHPFFCAFTPIKGELIQLTFDKEVKLLDKETILPGQLVIDDKSEQFIHQNGTINGAVSLHAYGAKNDREVREIYDKTWSVNLYRDAASHSR